MTQKNNYEGNIEDLLIVKDKDRKIDELKQEIDEKNKKLRDHDEFSKSQIKDLTSKVNSLSQEKRNLEKNNDSSLDNYANKKDSNFNESLMGFFWSNKYFHTLLWMVITITAGKLIYNSVSFNAKPEFIREKNKITHYSSKPVYSQINKEYLNYKEKIPLYKMKTGEDLDVFIFDLVDKSDSLISEDKLDEALWYYDLILDLDPKSILAYSGKIHVLKELGRYNEALTECNTALQVTGEKSLYSTKAGILNDLGRIE